MKMDVNLRAIIEFYDANANVRRHSNAIKTLAHEELGVQVLVDYLGKKYGQASALDGACTAKGGGAWLDKWVHVRGEASEWRYQVEVKGWSFHGYGGKTALPVNCPDPDLRKFMKEEFLRYWDPSRGRFHALGIDKVLREMNSSFTGEVRPLACLWTPLHPQGNIDEPFFIVENVQGSPFQQVAVFSVSSYLRQRVRAGDTSLPLDLPDTAARLHHLNAIFSATQPEAV